MRRLYKLQDTNFLSPEAIAKIVRQEEMLRTGGNLVRDPAPHSRLITSSQGRTYCFVFSSSCKPSDSASESFHEDASAYMTMLASEDVLRRDWDSPEEDAAWANL